MARKVIKKTVRKAKTAETKVVKETKAVKETKEVSKLTSKTVQKFITITDKINAVKAELDGLYADRTKMANKVLAKYGDATGFVKIDESEKPYVKVTIADKKKTGTYFAVPITMDRFTDVSVKYNLKHEPK